MTFKEFFKSKEEKDKKKYSEELWMSFGPQDNPSNPGTKRKNATNWLNKRYGGGAGVTGVMPGGNQPQVKA